MQNIEPEINSIFAPSRMFGHSNRELCQPILGVKRKLWRQDDEHAVVANTAFASHRGKVLQRDNYTCQLCSFKAAKFQEVHHLDDNHRNNEPGNLLTICNLCHQVFHLGMTAMRNGGFIAAIPELTQTEVNNLVRAIHVGESIANAEACEKLKSLYAIFRFRGDVLKTLYGIDISDPYTLAEVLSICTDKIFAKRQELLAPLRLVATKEAFHPGQLEYYATNNRSTFLPDNWQALGSQLLG